MEDMLMLASFWSNLFFAARIILAVAAFVAATALIIASGGTALLALGVGIVAGAAIYGALGFIKFPPEKKPEPPIITTTEYRISINFSPGNPYTIPYECNFHNAKIVTTTQGKNSKVNHSPATQDKIQASDGSDFETKVKNYLRDKLKPLGGDLRSITIYEEPFPGETPLEMIYNACKDQFPDVELHTTQEEYHD